MSAPSRFPFPWFPRGWFHVAASAELPARAVRPLRCFGRELVLWRDAAGAPHLLDAHCPHQGAHLGHGGVVLDSLLKCPYHGWRLGPDGRCRSVPGAREVPAHEPIGAWPLVEQDGSLLAFHAGPRSDIAGRAPGRDAPPALQLPPPSPVPEFTRAGWQRIDERTWTVASHVYEVIENLVDAAHFVGLHKTPSLPHTSFEADGQRARVRSTFQLDSLAGPVATTLESEGHGPGYWVLRFTGIVPAVVLTTATPLDEERLLFRLVFHTAGDPALGRAFADSVILEVDQDQLVWEHKLWRADPPLSEADGPIRPFREWCRQFHA
jgi:nitrite reductase/ring-hydroxylating ferredoxin subunit